MGYSAFLLILQKKYFMILSLRLKNFYSLRDDVILDFTADMHQRNSNDQFPENLLDFSGDKFVNILGLFGSNAAGKSNIINALAFCRNLVLTSHLNNEGDILDFEPFKFGDESPSEFEIDFVSEGVEYEYSFSLHEGRIIAEELFHYPNKRKAKVFSRTGSSQYSHRKGLIQRPGEVEVNTGDKTLFISRASSMNRPIAQTVYRFFLNGIQIGLEEMNLNKLTKSDFEKDKGILLTALEVSDSDIVDIRLIEKVPGQPMLQSFHRENPDIPFDFEKEESDGTKRLMAILMMLLKKILGGATLFLDEFDLKLHLRLAEFVLDAVRASHAGQLVFTSHNSNLMNTARLRREQIVFVNKQSDGNSEFIPLVDYEGVKNTMDIQKAYLQGRFDSVPYVGNIYSMLTQLMDSHEGTKE